MSRRTVASFTLVGLLGLSLAAPAAAQDTPRVRVVETRTGSFAFAGSYSISAPVELAPMPRVVPVVRSCAEEEVFQYERGTPPPPGPTAAAPMPRFANTVEYSIELGGGPVLFNRGQPGFNFTQAAPAAEPPRVCVQGPGGVFFQDVVPGTVVSRPAIGFAGSVCCNERNFCAQPSGPAPVPQQVAGTPGFFVFDDRGFEAFQSPTANLPNPMLSLGKCRQDDNGTWWVEVIRVPQPKFAPAPRAIYYIDRAVAQNEQPGCCLSTTAGSCNAWTVGLKAGQCETSAACSAKSSPFAGTWAREMEGMVVAATLSPCGEELKLCLSQCAEGHTVCLTVTADCKVTKEGLLHGVVTGIDLDVKSDPKATGDASFAGELFESAAVLQELVDTPFSFRVKQTSAGLMVSGLKMVSVGPVRGSELAILCGMFKPCKDGAVPVAKPMKIRQTGPGGMTLPSPQYLQHYPQYFSPDAECPLPREAGLQLAPLPHACPATTGCGTMPTTICPPPLPCQRIGVDFSFPCPPQAGWNPAKPANVPANEFGMMADVFGQMVGVAQPPAYLVPPPVAQSGGYIVQPGYLPPPPLMQPGCVVAGAPVMFPPPVAMQPAGYVMPSQPMPVVTQGMPYPSATAPRPSVTGTWVREVGPVVYVVKVAPDYLTVTATAASEVGGGKTMSQEMVLTADYHLSRDGTTLVGLITGVDVSAGGELPGELQLPEMQEEMSRLQKAYTDKPYAMSVRVYGDMLVIGNVRLPQAEGHDSPLSVISGRYRNAADKPLPKPKVMKPAAAPQCPSITGPVGSYPPAPVYDLPPGPVPSYGSPSNEAPRSSVAPSVNIPAQGVVPRELDAVSLPRADRIPPLAPRVSEAGAPPRATPTPPAVEEPKPKKKKKKATAQELPGVLLNVYSSDPNVRMQQFLYQPEDLRQFQNEWRRPWFTDQPSHLTPERVHGGIR